MGALAEIRMRTLDLVSGIAAEELEAVHSPLMSPLVWDLGHIAAFEDLWLVHRVGGREMIRPELAQVYDAFETPRNDRGTLPYLRTDEALAYLEQVHERVSADLRRRGPGDGHFHDLVLRHEQQHGETMLQTIELAHLRPGLAPANPPRPLRGAPTGLERVEVPAGPFALGAPGTGFAYDNELPRHAIHLPGFRIGRFPVTNATWLSFVEGGGYERREWWSAEGWAWKQEYDITGPSEWTADGREWRADEGYLALDPVRPVVHVSWFEAAAFARAHGARLPTEAEWEKAATWDQEAIAVRPPDSGQANLDQRTLGTAPAGAYPEGAAPSGCLGMLGDTWEWTSSDFGPYPGFRPEPYR
ncbi:MAG TPA: SUMF1/EgtB/PvdO family nonheme iron enzyme, partial [Solirubrobacteraceae bacterium]